MIENTLKSSFIARWIRKALPLFLLFSGFAFGQANYSPAELDTLVSTIALYPDPLLVHVLTASTYGDQIPAANAFAQSHKNEKGETLAKSIENANLTYDPSVQALIPFPTVLDMMAKYPTWTDQLGDAVAAQKDGVMDAVQRLRHKAYENGHLKSNEQVTVSAADTIIVVQPTRTEYVYVPVYNPRVVYYVRSDGYTTYVRYSSGVWLGTWYGEWGWGTCWFDWGPRVIYVRNYRWYPHRPIPHHPHRYRPPPRRFAPAPHQAPPPRHAPAPRMAPAHREGPAPAARPSAPPPAARSAAPAPAQRSVAPAPATRSSAPAPAMYRPAADNQAVYRTAPAPSPAPRVAPAPAPAPRATPAPAPRQSPAPAPRQYERNSRDDRSYDSGRSGSRSSGRRR